MKRRAKVDANQTEIVRQLRRIPNLNVEPTHRLGEGFPDILVGYYGVNFLFEIKNPENKGAKLTGDELLFKNRHRGQYDVVSTLADIIVVIAKGIDFKYVDRFNTWTQSIWGIDAAGYRKP